MNRLSDRISAALSSQRCPACGHFVTPALREESPSEAGEQPTEGKRWSFIWRPARGYFCPDCSFPLSRYEGRVVWIRLFMLGLILLTVALLLWVVALLGGGTRLFRTVRTLTFIGGAVVFLVGALGLVIGGRHQAPS